jgi:hypothetical protein
VAASAVSPLLRSTCRIPAEAHPFFWQLGIALAVGSKLGVVFSLVGAVCGSAQMHITNPPHHVACHPTASNRYIGRPPPPLHSTFKATSPHPRVNLARLGELSGEFPCISGAVILIIPGLLWYRRGAGAKGSARRLVPSVALLAVGAFIMVGGVAVTFVNLIEGDGKDTTADSGSGEFSTAWCNGSHL